MVKMYIKGHRGIAPLILNLWYYKEVKGQLHAQAVSCPGKNAGTH